MANNKIQIKRSIANNTVTGLSNGELAFTQASNTLHIGLPDGSGVLRIGGAQYPGTLTNNHALVANATGYVNEIRTANLVATKIYANGTHGTAGELLSVNGSGEINWIDANTLATSAAGSNTQVQFNNSGLFGGSSGFTFDSSSNAVGISGTLNLGPTGNNQVVNLSNTMLEVRGGWDAPNGLLNVIAGNYNGGDYAKITLQGNTHTVVVEADKTQFKTIAGAEYVVANTTGVFVNGTVNAASISVGTNFSVNTSQVTFGTGTTLSVNGAIGTANQVLRSDSSGVPYWSDDAGDISGVTAGDGLTGGGTSGDITLDVGAGDGIVVNASSVAVNANNGIVSNSSGVFVNAGTGVTVNASGVHIGQDVATTSNVQFNVVNASSFTIGTSLIANSSMLTFTGANIVATSATLSVLDTIVTGNLTINGTLTSVNTTSLEVKDSIIKLADNNSTLDTLDIGFYGVSGNASATYFSGLYRDASAGSLEAPVFKLFVSNNEPTTTVSDSAFYALATLNAYLQSGALVSNATNVSIVANSSVSVDITANTLSLVSPLSGTSGGTGLGSIGNNDILTGNSTNGFRTVSLGSDGYVLQSSGGSLVYDTLDGGTF